MGFLQGLGKVVGGIAGAVVGAPLGLLGIGGGAAVGSWLGGKVGQFAEGAICKAKEVLGNPGGRRGALIGGLAGLALAPLTGGLSIPIGAAIGGLIGNKPCHHHHRPSCHHHMGQYGHNNGCCSQGYGYPPSYPGGGCYPGGGFPGGGYPGGGYPGGGFPGGGMGGMGGGMMQMMMMMQMMQMMMMMGQMGGGMGMGGFGGGMGMGNTININFGNQGMGMFPPCY
ncbi:MAG: hypothetical protein KC800_21320 [Candidatus Eremiobacteraeota bacterium]|nr:hypothetical protein [Candidatus Eremiobacteraeota bacterium]